MLLRLGLLGIGHLVSYQEEIFLGSRDRGQAHDGEFFGNPTSSGGYDKVSVR